MEIVNSEYQDCIDFLNDCAQACYECYNSILSTKDLNDKSDLLMSLIDCAEHAKLTTNFIARNSEHVKEMALISAHLAKVTSELCEKFKEEYISITGQVCLETHEIIIDTFDDREH
ncbi:MAG TPA: hypothetical protein VIK84_01010 [Haloplasmataceae bacterium]